MASSSLKEQNMAANCNPAWQANSHSFLVLYCEGGILDCALRKEGNILDFSYFWLTEI